MIAILPYRPIILYAQVKVHKAPGVWHMANSAQDNIKLWQGWSVVWSAENLLYMDYFWRFGQCDIAAQIAQMGLWPVTDAYKCVAV
jgi:hypothetical protein